MSYKTISGFTFHAPSQKRWARSDKARTYTGLALIAVRKARITTPDADGLILRSCCEPTRYEIRHIRVDGSFAFLADAPTYTHLPVGTVVDTACEYLSDVIPMHLLHSPARIALKKLRTNLGA